MPTCGETIKQNLSYLIQAETLNPETRSCTYTICPIQSDINRIRLDLKVKFTVAKMVNNPRKGVKVGTLMKVLVFVNQV